MYDFNHDGQVNALDFMIYEELTKEDEKSEEDEDDE